MQGFDREKRLTTVICRANAALAIPYLLAAIGFGVGLVGRHGMDAYPDGAAPSDVLLWDMWGGMFPATITALFLLFYALFIYSLLRIRSWCRWFVLLDALGGYLFAIAFSVIGVHRFHPGQAVYGVVLDTSAYLGGDCFVWSVIAGKVTIAVFNLVFFGATPLLRLGERHPAVHILWVIPAAILSAFPVYVAATYGQFQSLTAEHLAEQQFRKLSCGEIRSQHGQKREFAKAGDNVRVSFDYDFASVTVRTPDGRVGMSGGPAWFCRPLKNPLDDQLLEAAERGDAASVLHALDQGADVNAEAHFKWTPLMFAAWKGHREVFDALLTRGANIDAHDELHESVLMICAREGRTEFARTLLERGANMNASNAGGFTALMNAAESGHAETVQLLLTHGADTDAQNREGLTAVAMAEQGGHSEVVRLLKAHKP